MKKFIGQIYDMRYSIAMNASHDIRSILEYVEGVLKQVAEEIGKSVTWQGDIDGWSFQMSSCRYDGRLQHMLDEWDLRRLQLKFPNLGLGLCMPVDRLHKLKEDPVHCATMNDWLYFDLFRLRLAEFEEINPEESRDHAINEFIAWGERNTSVGDHSPQVGDFNLFLVEEVPVLFEATSNQEVMVWRSVDDARGELPMEVQPVQNKYLLMEKATRYVFDKYYPGAVEDSYQRYLSEVSQEPLACEFALDVRDSSNSIDTIVSDAARNVKGVASVMGVECVWDDDTLNGHRVILDSESLSESSLNRVLEEMRLKWSCVLSGKTLWGMDKEQLMSVPVRSKVDRMDPASRALLAGARAARDAKKALNRQRVWDRFNNWVDRLKSGQDSPPEEWDYRLYRIEGEPMLYRFDRHLRLNEAKEEEFYYSWTLISYSKWSTLEEGKGIVIEDNKLLIELALDNFESRLVYL